MGYTFNLEVPAGGAGIVPIAVSGDTYITSTDDIQIAYDENGFNTNQWITQTGQFAPQIMRFPLSGKTILWVRQPAAAATALTVNVWTDIGSVNV